MDGGKDVHVFSNVYRAAEIGNFGWVGRLYTFSVMFIVFSNK